MPKADPPENRAEVASFLRAGGGCRAAGRHLLVVLMMTIGLQTTARAQDPKQESPANASQWGMSIWGLSYHPDKTIDYDAFNWGLGIRYYTRPQWRWLGKNQDNRVP